MNGYLTQILCTCFLGLTYLYPGEPIIPTESDTAETLKAKVHQAVQGANILLLLIITQINIL